MGSRAEIASQAERWRLWVPVAFGFGAAAYMTLQSEPPLWIGLAVLLAGGVTAWAGWRFGGGGLSRLMLVTAFLLLGFAGAKLRTEAVRAPVVPDFERPIMVEGWVVDVDTPSASGGRLVIAPVHIEGLDPGRLPHRIRITVPPDSVSGPGQPIRVRAGLGPPPAPASPGAYDFARDAWFNRIGGVGFAVSTPEPVGLAEPPARLGLLMDINTIRWSLARRIVDRLGPEQGGIAAAMVTGHEAWISTEQYEAMRASGLAHILSISGLHMAIVGGFVFALIRFGIALWPWLALRIDGKKTAAVAGLLAVAIYLLISGAPPPAIRAAVTAGVAFLAILVDRRAISLDTLAVAALLILLLMPEAAVSPGFQMSFAATTALVALAERLPRPVREIDVPWWIKLPQGVGVWMLVSIAASLVAGLATGPFAMHHFNRMASYGLLANLLVAPISSFIMMPALALGAVLEPFGLGGIPLSVAGWSIGLMTSIAAWTAGLPGSTVTVASGPDWTLAVSFLGILILCLWDGRLRWLGAPLALAVALWPRPGPPDLWIASDGAAVAVRAGDRAIPARPDSRAFALQVWSRRRGLILQPEAAATQFDCKRNRCLPLRAPAVSLWSMRKAPSPAMLAYLCEAEVAVFRGDAGPGCPEAVTLDADDFAAGGSAELYRTAEGWRIVWAQPLRGRRPWTSGSGG